MIRRVLQIGLASLFSMYFLSSCNNTGTTTADNQAESTVVSAATPAFASDTIIIEEMQFKPQEITINKGDTLVFVNKDIVAHDATDVDSIWKSPAMQNGDTWQIVPQKSTDYYCSIHMVMKGKIIINDMQ